MKSSLNKYYFALPIYLKIVIFRKGFAQKEKGFFYYIISAYAYANFQSNISKNVNKGKMRDHLDRYDTFVVVLIIS